ncbi:MAG: c-type cytochrome [Brevundimonas sp.]
MGMAVMTLALAACSGADDGRTRALPSGDPARGLRIMDEVGCGACHDIPGLDWPRGQVGPPLSGLGDRALIGSGLPNRPETLVPYLINAPAVDPGSPMPPMPVTEEEARDIAAYLYEH